MKERLRVVKCTQRHRKIKEATEAQVKEAAGTNSKKLTVTFQHAWDIKKTTTMTTQEKTKTWKEKEEEDSNTATSMEMRHCVWEKLKNKAKTVAAAIKRTTKKNESGSTTLNKMKDGSKSKMESGNKDLCGDSTGNKNEKKTRNKDVTFIVLQKNEFNALKWKNRRKWKASSTAADGMQYYWAKRGDKTSQKSGRHITNTYSWEQDNTTRNTVFELCWTRCGSKELLILNTSTNGPSPPRSW